MSNIINISGQPLEGPGEPVEEVISILEQYLERARSGEIKGLAIVGACEDGSFVRNIVGQYRPYSMVGGLEYIKHHILETAPG